MDIEKKAAQITIDLTLIYGTVRLVVWGGEGRGGEGWGGVGGWVGWVGGWVCHQWGITTRAGFSYNCKLLLQA